MVRRKQSGSERKQKGENRHTGKANRGNTKWKEGEMGNKGENNKLKITHHKNYWALIAL